MRRAAILPPPEPVHTEIRAVAGGFEIVTAHAPSPERTRPLIRLGRTIEFDRRLADGVPVAFKGAAR